MKSKTKLEQPNPNWVDAEYEATIAVPEGIFRVRGNKLFQLVDGKEILVADEKLRQKFILPPGRPGKNDGLVVIPKGTRI